MVEGSSNSVGLGCRWTLLRVPPCHLVAVALCQLPLGSWFTIHSMEISPLPLDVVTRAVEGFRERLSGGRLKEK